MKTPEVISTSDLQERGYLYLHLRSALESGTTGWRCHGTPRSIVLQVSLPPALTACSSVPEHILTNTEGGGEALPAAFSKGEAQHLTSTRSQRDWREDQQIECRSFKVESYAEKWMYQTCSPSSDTKSLDFKSGHSFSHDLSELLSSCCSISGQEKEGQGLPFMLA